MQPIKTILNPTDAAYLQAKNAMQTQVTAWQTLLKQATEQGKEKNLATARKQERLTGRERIELLLDKDTPFWELLPQLGYKANEEKEGIKLVAGIGVVSKKLCLIAANIGTLKGDLFDETYTTKQLRIQQIAEDNRLPFVQLLEGNAASIVPSKPKTDSLKKTTAGVNLVFDALFLPLLQNANNLDYTIFIKNRIPQPLEHTADYLAENELDGLRIAREVLDSFFDNHTFSPIITPTDIAPLYPITDLIGMQFGNEKGLFSIRELIARIVDKSEFVEYKAGFGKNMVAGFANIHGFPIGILANNAPIGDDEADKVADFVRRCDQQHRSLLFLENNTAFSTEIPKEIAEKRLNKIENALKSSTIPTLFIKIEGKNAENTPSIHGNEHQPHFTFSYLEDLPQYDTVILPTETRNHLAFALAVIYNSIVEGEI